MDINKIFLQLGLTEEHAKVYFASLEWGETTVSNLAYKSKIPRTTVYMLLEELVNIGLIAQILRKSKKQYLAESPEYLMALLQKQKVDVEGLIYNLENEMTQLKSMQKVAKNKPEIHYLEGAEGIKQAYEMSLQAKTEVLVQCYTSDYGDVVPGEFFDNYFKAFFGSNIKTRELLTTSDESYAQKWGSAKNLQLLVDFTKISDSIETDFMIFDEKVVFVSFNKENPYALVISDLNIYNAVRSLFELAWAQAATQDPRVLRGEKVRVSYEA